jgi:hypothetical protein
MEFSSEATAQAPFLTGQFPDQPLFVSADGLPGSRELLVEAEEGLHVFAWEHVDGAVETVTEGVEAILRY